jgi:hypothetical protein
VCRGVRQVDYLRTKLQLEKDLERPLLSLEKRWLTAILRKSASDAKKAMHQVRGTLTTL